MKTFCIIVLTVLSSIIINAQGDFGVLKQAGPVYPAAARAVRGTGEVGVEVRIDSGGKVSEAKAYSGHPLLRAASEMAAKQWLFCATADESPRTRLINFIFKAGGEVRYIAESEKSDEAVTTHNFLNSLTAEVSYETLVPRLLLLPREKGVIKVRNCPLHKGEMSVEIQSCKSDDSDTTFSRSESYNDAEDELFPEANVFEGRGCGYSGIDRAEVHYCPVCRSARSSWLAGQN